MEPISNFKSKNSHRGAALVHVYDFCSGGSLQTPIVKSSIVLKRRITECALAKWSISLPMLAAGFQTRRNPEKLTDLLMFRTCREIKIYQNAKIGPSPRLHPSNVSQFPPGHSLCYSCCFTQGCLHRVSNVV